MGLLTQEIKEIRQMIKLYDAGKLTTQQVTDKMKMFKEIRARAQLILSATIACSNPRQIENRLHSLNVISRGEAVQEKSDIEIEYLKCPDQNDKLITRSECLTYSGDSKNYETCKSCNNYKITRDLLCPIN